MNPQFDKPTNLNLPPPIPEVGSQSMPTPGAETLGQTPEAMPATPETSQNSPQTPPVTAIPQFMIPPPVASSGNSSTLTATATNPAIADDADLIEKEWVTKAKAIVEKTKEDPHEQTKEMTHLKSDYLKKRYNKTMKMSE
ncbi:MAG TPA: hypothetical protein VLG37_03185 [Candidatus Saccharimonadales bacterium]|nr:hypothetical protein [Candidatus Saccharimonadales bacterium]